MEMFANLGRTLSLLRELRGKSQGWVAQEAGIGKSQLSKYENGKELPKLDSLEKVLNALRVSCLEFFYTLYLVDTRAASLAQADAAQVVSSSGTAAPGTATGPGIPMYLPPFPKGNPLLSPSTDEAFTRLFADLLALYRLVFEQLVLGGLRRSEDIEPPS
jgi:transcriptional regulator with XRE-family HTH domain